MDERVRKLQDLDAEELEAIYQAGTLPAIPAASMAKAESHTSGFGRVEVIQAPSPQAVVTLRVAQPA